jgi:hypothetical protein
LLSFSGALLFAVQGLAGGGWLCGVLGFGLAGKTLFSFMARIQKKTGKAHQSREFAVNRRMLDRACTVFLLRRGLSSAGWWRERGKTAGVCF